MLAWKDSSLTRKEQQRQPLVVVVVIYWWILDNIVPGLWQIRRLMKIAPDAMHSLRRRHYDFHLFGRTDGFGVHPPPIMLEVPSHTANELEIAGLMKRSPPGSEDGGSGGRSESSGSGTTSTSSSSSSTCTPGDTSAKCERPTSSRAPTLAIALGVVYVSSSLAISSFLSLIFLEVFLSYSP